MLKAEQILNHRYQLTQLLGENASRQTWLAIDRASQPQDTVVMKLLVMNPQMQWDEAKLLEREAQVLQKLKHPRIPRYHDYFILDQLADSRFPWFCLVQSHVPGHSLQQLLDQGRHFTEAEVEKIEIVVLSILVYLHQFNPPILHRDIKPSNLIWGEGDLIYLIDFGSVQDRAALEGTTFTVVGTYGYVPMEQFSGRAVPASDLYALGATLIHLLTGTAPADLPSQNARIQFAQQVSIDPAFVNWVSKLTEPDLENRLSTARQALDALKHRNQLSLPTVNRKPKGSQIQLKKTVDQLEIKIPPRGWQALSWLYGLGIFGSWWYLLLYIRRLVLVPWMGWIYLIFLLPALIHFLLPALTQTVIRGDRTHFTFYWTLFGLPVWKRQIKTAKIDPVIGIYDKMKQDSIFIQAGITILSTNAMAEVERHWLIQEIKTWLNSGQP
jgi:serine/threonine protein kinase